MFKIFSKIRVVIKWGAIVMAFIKAFEVLADELEQIETDKTDKK